MPHRLCRGRAWSACLVVLVAGVLTDCRSAPLRPPMPEPDSAARQLADPAALQPYLDAYPLGEDATRVDLLGHDGKRSMHLVQTRRAFPRHRHNAASENSYVLSGRGRVTIEGKTYPAVPGSAFRIDRGRLHSVQPDAGVTLVAIVYYTPPQLGSIEQENVPE